MTIQANDFEGNSLTGTTIVSNQNITIDLKINPIFLEGDKIFNVRLSKSLTGSAFAESSNITLKDNSTLDTFSPNVTTIHEGAVVQYDIITSNVNGDLTLYYSTEGNVDYDDFIGGNVGSFVLSNNYANIILESNADLSFYPDTEETFILQIRRDSTTGEIIANADPVVIVDTSNSVGVVSIELTSPENIYEAEEATLNINTRNAPGNNGGTLYYTVTGNTDIFSSNSGSIVVNDNFASLQIIPEASVFENETKEFQIAIQRISTSMPASATTNVITVSHLPTNISANVKISLVNNTISNVSTTFANSAVRFTANTRNATNGETFYYVVTGNAAPYVTSNTGSFTVTSNVGTFDITPVYSDVVERELGIEVKRSSIAGTVLAVSNNVEVLPNVEIFLDGTINKTSIIESEQVELKLNTKYRPNVNNYYYEVFGTADIFNSTTGTTKSGSNIIVISEASVPTGQTRNFYIQVKENNSSGNIIYTSPNVTVSAYTTGVVDSKTSIVTSASANNTSIGKFQSVVFTINTLNASNGSILYFATNGTATSTDFTTANTGSVTVNGNTASVTLTVASGAVVNTGRSFVLDIKRGSTTGKVLQSSQTVTFFNNEYISATGGTIVDGGGFRTHIFTGSGTFAINGLSYTAPRNTFDYLVVAGGGGGGGTDGNGVGGGGAGGMLSGTRSVTAIEPYPVQVGGGGAGAPGSNGGASAGGPSFIKNGPEAFNQTATGGGHGGSRYIQAASPGGSGGGGAAYNTGAGAGTAGQGNSGAAGTPSPPTGGGGGGKGGAGSSTSGGIGAISPISPPSYGTTGPTAGRWFAGGGGGSREPNVQGAGGAGGGGTGGGTTPATGTPGTANTGGGGGAAGAIAQQRAGGSGGSGIVIVRYPYA